MNDFKIPIKDFKIIELNDLILLFYVPNSQLYPIDDTNLIEYLLICQGKKSKSLNANEIECIYGQLMEVFKGSQAPLERMRPINGVQAVTLPISGNCNLNCAYCYARSDGNFPFEDMTPQIIEQIINILLDKYKLTKLTIVFFGGEPLLRYDLIRHCIEYVQINYQKTTVLYSITTNCTILKQKHINFIKTHNIALLVSLDGPRDINKNRIFFDGKSSFDIVYKNIMTLKKQKVPMEIRSTLTNETKNIVEVYDFFERMKIPFNIVFAYESANKNHILAKYENKSLLNIKKQLEDLRNYYVQKINQKQHFYCVNLLKDLAVLAGRGRSCFGCSGGCSMFSIVANGDVYTCEHFAGIKKYCIGNIFKDDQDALLNSDLIAQNVNDIYACKDCWVRYLCAGGCFSENILSNSERSFPIPERCKLRKIIWEFKFKLYSEVKIIDPHFLKPKQQNIP